MFHTVGFTSKFKCEQTITLKFIGNHVRLQAAAQTTTAETPHSKVQFIASVV